MREIGGFLDIELRGYKRYHTNALKLNSCRNALRFYVRKKKLRQLYISYFTCDAVLLALQKENIDVRFYRIDEDLLPIDIPKEIGENSAILYANYWGLCDKQIEQLVSLYGDCLIIDAAQAFYFKPPKGVISINSARKFFGVPDGAYLCGISFGEVLPLSHSYGSCNHLLRRFEVGAKLAYQDYLDAEKCIDNLDIGQMSGITQGLLSLVDFEKVASIRRNNYNYLHKSLQSLNSLSADILKLRDNVPMVYPLKVTDSRLRSVLIDNSIYVATYWPNVFEWCDSSDVEFDLAQHVLPLPIDQRYGVEDMDNIILCIKQFYEKE